MIQSLCDVSGDFSTSRSYLNSVPEALSSGAGINDLPEILWNFSHFEGKRRLTLAQNPHFYGNLPMSPDAYGGTFKGKCIENRLPDKVFVPTNKSRRVYFNFTGHRRVFDVWKTNSTLIFKGLSFALLILPLADIFPDFRGNLEGEATVGSSIRPFPSSFQYCKNHTQGVPEEVEITDDWRGLIRTAEDSTRTHICVSAPSTQPTGRVV